MYTVCTIAGSKVLHLSKCCYCVHARIEHEVTCKKQYKLNDNCADMEPVESVSERFDLLFATLPHGYRCQ